LGGFHRSSQHLDVRSCDGPVGGMDKELTGRSAMKSPGKPSHRREVELWFWREIAKGLSSEDAAAAVGVSSAAGVRWFRERGGMATLLRDPVSCRYLCFAEREEIALLRAEGKGVREIAREIGRSPSTISRELRRNAATRGGKLEYRASVAQWKAELVARRPKTAKLAADDRLREYVQDRLAGKVRQPDGTVAAGPAVKPWKGRNKPRRQDRRWATAWSPEQISARLRIDFPDDPGMRISHEAIYQSLFVQGRGALARELTACLRTGRVLRVPRARVGQRGKGFISGEVMISQRPAEAADRAVPGHWEGDLIIGTDRSAIGTLVERSSRFTMLLHLPPLPDRDGPRVKNGPAVTGAGAEAVRDAITAQLGGLPEHLRRSLTWDQGAELAQHARLKIDTGLQVFFCDPQSPWQRGTNENTNGLLRQYFPKGTDLARHSPNDLAAVADALNSRPRKTLGWRTPAEVLNAHLSAAA
jgi:IS30 family transposase